MARTAIAIALLALACSGSDQPVGEIQGPGRGSTSSKPAEAARSEAQPSGVELAKQILFGDLHVHSTYSIDAFLYGLPLFGGEGVHPPADACDFARWCAELDFFSLNDHAEGLTPALWQRSLESLRECDARSGDPASPDLVPFAGWEWTQTGASPETHFGHKNVIFPTLDADRLPARPISALADDVMGRRRFLWVARGAEALLSAGPSGYADFLWWLRQLSDTPMCAPGVDVRALPADCQENAATPEILFEKLRQWGFPHLVIPHGLTWGIHAPPGATLANQLTRDRLAPESQRLIEVFSGHGAAERYDPAAARADAAAARGVCAEPTPDFLPCCWRAGELVRARCADPDSADCEERVDQARRFAVEAGTRPNWVVPDAAVEDWLDCDQDRGAFKSAMSPRPNATVQAALAAESREERDPDGRPLRFRFGLVGSSDTHTARAGNGYKQVHRQGMTDVRGLTSERGERWLSRFVSGEAEEPGRAVRSPAEPSGFRGLIDVERIASFLYPGGLVAVHAAGRDRQSLWDALMRREVYATSGPRILLWFDLVNGPEGRAPMGSAVVQGEVPRFEVRALGSFVQRPGCPAETREALSPERLESLCLGECYHPSERRHAIEAIEIVRIRPGADPSDLARRIEDPWLRIPCPGDAAGCSAVFEDPEFGDGDRVYYARALQEPTAAIDGANLRTRFDAEGAAVGVDPCRSGWRGAPGDDCLAPVSERAWSSPLFLDAPRAEPQGR